ncbi:MAG: hypothetical protein WCR52_08805 [Bacteroidota bacterium]
MRRPVDAVVTRLVAVGLLAGVGLSLPLWFTALRSAMPTVPVFDFLAEPGILGLGIVLLGAFLVLYPNRKSPRLILLLFLIAAILSDVNRLQAWVWFYLLLLTAAIFYKDDEGKIKQSVVFQWIIASVYVWGGIYKITPYFAEDNFSWFCDAFAFMKPMGAHPFWGYVLAFSEAVLGIGLLVPFTRRVFRYLALLFHGSVVLMLSPLGLNWNLVVIPWNLTMATMVWLLFSSGNAISLQAIFSPSKKLRSREIVGVTRSHADNTPGQWEYMLRIILLRLKKRLLLQFWPQYLILFAACLAPALNLLGFWPDALSWKMYSNTQSEATFYAPAGAPKGGVSKYWDQHAFNNGHDLLLDDWSNEELKTPILPQRRVFMQIGRYLCNCTEQKDSAGLYILTVDPYHKAAEQMEFIPCDRLLQQKR